MSEKSPGDKNISENSGEDEKRKRIYQTIAEYSLHLSAARAQYDSGIADADPFIAGLVDQWIEFAKNNPDIAKDVFFESYDVGNAQKLLYGKTDKNAEEKKLSKRLASDKIFRDAVEESYVNDTLMGAFGSGDFFVRQFAIEEIELIAKLTHKQGSSAEKHKEEFVALFIEGVLDILEMQNIKEFDDPAKTKEDSERLAILQKKFPVLYKKAFEKYQDSESIKLLFGSYSKGELSPEGTDELLRLGEKHPDLFDREVANKKWGDELSREEKIRSGEGGALENSVAAINRHPAEITRNFLNGSMNPVEAFNFFQVIVRAEDSIPKEEIIGEMERYFAEIGLPIEEKQKYGIISGAELTERISRWFMKEYLRFPYDPANNIFDDDMEDE